MRIPMPVSPAQGATLRDLHGKRLLIPEFDKLSIIFCTSASGKAKTSDCAVPNSPKESTIA